MSKTAQNRDIYIEVYTVSYYLSPLTGSLVSGTHLAGQRSRR